MKNLGYLDMSRLCFFDGIKDSNLNSFSVDSDFCPEPSFVWVDALNASLGIGWRRLIHPILGAGGQSKVFPSVIGFNAIDVVNFAVRLLSSHYKPSQSMSNVSALVNANIDVAVGLNPSNLLALLPAFPVASPMEITRFRVV